ncbi:hypothetical protein [Acidovorax sp. BL-A-41-H1]|uniref:hypothetical protein n=1 Tax=Acidovorax sp. BL-A-41-H1 TaxID=3421102 RepID=UPI003F78C939
MTVETATFISQLDTTLPTAADLISEGDDHIRLTKTVLKTQFPNFGTTAVTASATELNYCVGVTSAIQPQFTAKANKAGETYTGTHNYSGATAVTLPAATTIGVVTAAELLRLAGVTSPLQTQIDSKGAISGQTWTGTHNYTGATITVPTATAGDATNNAASTAFVSATAFSAALPGQSGNAGRFVTTNGTVASWASVTGAVVVISTPTNAVRGSHYVFTASTTLTLPSSPSPGDWVRFSNRSGTVSPVIARNGQNIMGLAEDLTIDATHAPGLLVFADATRGWVFA